MVRKTPLLEFDHLNEVAGRRVLVKLETMQHTGAFKFRGATAKLTLLSDAQRQAGVVAYSTGNHGMAVAAAAQMLGIKATIVVPIDTPQVKIDRMAESGAAIRHCDRFKENGEEIARTLASETEATFVHPFDDADVIAGQGTLAAEMIEQARAINSSMDALLVNSAGGGFVSGCLLASKALSPSTQVWSVECTAWDAIRRSMSSGCHEDNLSAPKSVCDAIQARAPGATGYRVFSQLLDGAIAVTDDQALDALRYAFNRLRLVVEPGGVVGLAAVLQDMLPAEFKTVGIVLCGANVDPASYASWLEAET
ncbi:MAG: threonine/serine dehydratase [Pseudomonadota bacterium]